MIYHISAVAVILCLRSWSLSFKSGKIWDTAVGTRTSELAWFASIAFISDFQGGREPSTLTGGFPDVITSPQAIWFLTCLYLTHGEGCPSSRMGGCFLWGYVTKPGFTPPLHAGMQTHSCNCGPGEHPGPWMGKQVWHWLLHTPVNVLCVWKMKYHCW